MAVANAATNQSFRKRFLKTGLVVLCSAFLGGTFAAEALRRKAKTNSLALNLMGLPTSHREMITTFENLENASLTPHTYVSSAESLLPHVRKLKPTLATHHVLRIQAANFLKKYHSALSQVLNEKDINNELELEEYLLHLRRRISDMNLAFDFVNFKQSEVSDSITNVVKFNKMDYARLGRDAQKIRTAFDEIYNRNKQNPGEQNTETSSMSEFRV